ncbi:SDR family NAD(P)-dependent oxidoreductase [Humibacter sp. BT305]|uniref:Short-chain dehydrogenase n=1 Tax=Cnuibacter physcomitrellae TaxID=1619308 RepID=A0A1X9LT38_9MICO|nr:SDR family NAD(P)-dependent oxidoreductase [Cnuibacter physcomitrellae]ARJ05060.1 short-chain dehydrogenase [Cnuibacter physcomitrellae]AXH36290.1 SDR family NAD(P)-dependent oxidoreductase [Humibacter sp. BT305]MCS5498773.1 SDR family NAD(P)-dependent oxidoreductase [Cnuibacter physcomitrellae]GGI34863.1 short-chain dehydrogenase [Cnuibacter physcomitrellae]
MATALVTGGTSGIGAAFARALALRGYDMVLVARNEERLAAMALELEAYGVSVETISADLAVRADVDRVAARLEDEDRPVDMLVNNAGFGLHSSLIDRDVSVHEQAFAVMCLAVLVLGGAAARAMTKRHRGTIVVVSSVAGTIATGNYSAVKAWTTAYAEGLAVELKRTGVQVTALLPGWVRTEFHQRAGIRTTSIPEQLWLDADDLVDEALRDVAKGKVISVPSARFKLLLFFTRHLPRATIRWISGNISRSRSRPVGG